MRQMRVITIVAVVCSFISCIIFGLLYVKAVNNTEKEIYVVSDAGDFMAKRNDLGIRQDFEVKNHIRLFLQDFYENDQYTFNKNIDAALNLIDRKDGNRIYSGFNAKAYNVYVQNNAHSKVVVDSIKVDMNVRPYRAKVWFQIVLHYGGNTQPIYNCAITEIIDNPRSEKNPFGLLLQNFNFIEYKVDAGKAQMINDSLNKANTEVK